MFFFVYFNVFSELQPFLLRLLDSHIQKTDQNNSMSYVMHGHVAALLILLSEVAKSNFQLIVPFVPLLTGLTIEKWSKQCAGLTEFSVRHKF